MIIVCKNEEATKYIKKNKFETSFKKTLVPSLFSWLRNWSSSAVLDPSLSALPPPRDEGITDFGAWRTVLSSIGTDVGVLELIAVATPIPDKAIPKIYYVEFYLR